MMLPLPRATSPGPNALASRYVPLRLTSITRSNSSSVVSSTCLRTLIPGVAPRTSVSGCAAANATTDSASVTSTAADSALYPCPSIAAMVSFRPSTLTSATTRLAPYCASAMLAARTSPLPPTTTTTLRRSSRNSDVKSIESDIFFFLPKSCTVVSGYVGMTRDWVTRSAPAPLLPWSGRRGGGAAQNLDDGGVVGASEAGAAAGKVELLSCAGKRGGVGLRAGRFGDQTHVLDENVNRGP